MIDYNEKNMINQDNLNPEDIVIFGCLKDYNFTINLLLSDWASSNSWVVESAFLGHETTHCPQNMHFVRDSVISKTLSATFATTRAFAGQFLTHILQPMHFSLSKAILPL